MTVPSFVLPLRAALMACGSAHRAQRRKACIVTVPRLCRELQRLAACGGTAVVSPAQLVALADAGALVATLMRLADARDFATVRASTPYREACDRVEAALADLATPPVAMDRDTMLGGLVHALQEKFGTRLVPVVRAP